ncbi:hypothetical protein GHT06_003544 [Daphnia sinensis]|uniref:Uncharacterized protein n=1 Tax=Daphnia sinensis TaxID=1820382 RepID=A0AAD5PL61_9CRUS|nr:hypothetical protein GHT06_003544 [Daphnia sinensis]
MVLSYSTRVQISKSAQLRLGAGLNINSVRLDGTQLTTEQANDPTVMQYFGGFAKMNILDLNLGLSLTHPNYYVSYGVHNVNQGRMSSGDIFMEKKPMVGIAQAGYRNSLTPNLDVIVNGMWRTQSNLPANIELNTKLYFTILSGSEELGFLMKSMRLGYVYERPMLKSYLLPNTTHELMLSIGLFTKAQEVKKTQESSVPENVAYIVDGKFMKDSDLSKITADQIESVNVIKRDTLIDNRRYDAQLFVRLKKIYPKELPKKD